MLNQKYNKKVAQNKELFRARTITIA